MLVGRAVTAMSIAFYTANFGEPSELRGPRHAPAPGRCEHSLQMASALPARVAQLRHSPAAALLPVAVSDPVQAPRNRVIRLEELQIVTVASLLPEQSPGKYRSSTALARVARLSTPACPYRDDRYSPSCRTWK